MIRMFKMAAGVNGMPAPETVPGTKITKAREKVVVAGSEEEQRTSKTVTVIMKEKVREMVVVAGSEEEPRTSKTVTVNMKEKVEVAGAEEEQRTSKTVTVNMKEKAQMEVHGLQKKPCTMTVAMTAMNLLSLRK
jgi:phosphotransacetylase